MKEFQVLHVNRGAAGGMSSSSPSSSATARGGRGGDGRDLLVMSKGAKLVGARKRTARFFSPTFDGSANSTSVEGGNSDSRGGGGGGGGGGGKEAIGSIIANLCGKNTASTPLCSGAL